MTSENDNYGKYVAIEKAVTVLEGHESMVDEKEENKSHSHPKKLRYYHIEKNYKIS